MTEINEKVISVISGMNECLTENGFVQVKADLDCAYAYECDKGSIKISYDTNKIYLYAADSKFEDAADEDFKRISLSLIDEESDAKDIRYIANDFSETITDKFGTKSVIKKNNYKAPPTVSKTAVKKNNQSYNEASLASKICMIYPELRDEYKANGAKYGEFLAEEFFTEHANKFIVNTIMKNDPQTMKKLFNVLNEMYDDGSNDVQDVIAVTILGELNNDTELLANCVDYMSETMAPVVIAVNRYLASASGKKARKLMLNPPPYKPKKEKKKGFMASMMEQQNSLQQ